MFILSRRCPFPRIDRNEDISLPLVGRAGNHGAASAGERQIVSVYACGASPEGVLDMAGNVWPWFQDWWGPYLEKELNGPVGSATSRKRARCAFRGGRWYDEAWACRRPVGDGGPESAGVGLWGGSCLAPPECGSTVLKSSFPTAFRHFVFRDGDLGVAGWRNSRSGKSGLALPENQGISRRLGDPPRVRQPSSSGKECIGIVLASRC